MTGVQTCALHLEFAERDEDPRKVAETIGLLRTAQAASTETLVRMAQPDLEGDELAAEVQKILDEQGFSDVPDPRGFPDDQPDDGSGES